ncbi:MAG: protein kinase domain-containing protein [Nocardioidaceae bacterium]
MHNPAPADPLVGRLLDERYRVEAKIARGGMATVYVATDLRLDRRIALKVMPHALADDDDFTSRFVREARAAARLTHPNVVAVYDQGEDDGVLFLAMEYVDGRRTLRDLVREQAPLPPGSALAIFEEILRAMAAAHESGIIHRDIKPENVLIGPRGQVKVADFGLARAISSSTSATATGGVLMGTVSYLPPELVTDGRADSRSDVYSLGVVLFELLTGQKPHTGETPIQVAYKHVHEDVPAPSSLTPGIPPYLDAYVARATSRSREVRPADASVMLHQLRRVRHAVDHGVDDDAELTDDLTPMAAVPRSAAGLPLAYAGAPAPSRGMAGADGHFSPSAVSGFGQDAAGDARTTVVGAHGTRPVATAEAPWFQQQAPAPPLHGSTATKRGAAPRRRRRGWVAFLVVLVLAASAAVAGWYYDAGRYQQTPDVTSMSQAAAAAKLEAAGLSLDVTATSYSETVAAGLLISTDPGPGQDVLADGTVAAVISAGPERHDVPSLSGMTESEAAKLVTGVHLSVGRVGHVWSETVAAGVVVSVRPEPGTPLKRNAPVSMVVSKGPQPIAIPSFVNKDASAAVARLTALGFSPEQTERYDDQVAAGVVITQSPRSGTGHRGDSIRLSVSRGPHLVPVPDVDNSGVAAAEAALQQAGFSVDVQKNTPSFGLGFVVSQSPSADAMAPYGSTVTIYIV